MTTYIDTKPEIDWSTFPDSDGEPMAENTENFVQAVDLIFALQRLLAAQGHMQALVGGNQLLYYNPSNGREHLSPDVYLAFGVTPPAPPKWQTWVQGKCPDMVWEITSPSTQDEDLGHKREIYARLKVQEYYIFDPQGNLDPPFQGFSWRDGLLAPLPVLASGGIVSALLRAELRPIPMAATRERPAATYLRVIDPTTAHPIVVPEELSQQLDDANRDVLAANALAVATEQARQAAEERAAAEEQARRAAEERAAQAEVALHAALARLEQRQDGA